MTVPLTKKSRFEVNSFFPCWLKGHISQTVRWSYKCEFNTTHCLLLGMRRFNIQNQYWPGGVLLWRGYRKWNVFVTVLAEPLCECWFFGRTAGKNESDWRWYLQILSVVSTGIELFLLVTCWWTPVMLWHHQHQQVHFHLPVIQPGEWFFASI